MNMKKAYFLYNINEKVKPEEKELISDETVLGKFRAGTSQANAFVTFFMQLGIMLKRNFLLQLRSWQGTLSQTVLAPLLFHLLLFILQQADYARQRVSDLDPTPYSLNGIDACQGRNPDDPCIDIMYTPAIEPYSTFMTTFASLNKDRFGSALALDTDFPQTLSAPSRSFGIVPVPDADFIYDYALAFPNVTRWAVSFSQSDASTAETPQIQYQVWFNSTGTSNGSDVFGLETLSFMRGLDEAIISTLHAQDSPLSPLTHAINVEMQDWPILPAETLSDGIVQRLGAVFFFCSEMVIFISVLSSIVAEKEMKLRIALEMAGLKPRYFSFVCV